MVTHGMQPGAGHDHRLGLAANPPGHLLMKVIRHNLHLLTDSMLVQIHKRAQQVGGLTLLVTRVFFNGLKQAPISFIGSIVF